MPSSLTTFGRGSGKNVIVGKNSVDLVIVFDDGVSEHTLRKLH